jgi:polysaccharide biosynthesis/export protein
MYRRVRCPCPRRPLPRKPQRQCNGSVKPVLVTLMATACVGLLGGCGSTLTSASGDPLAGAAGPTESKTGMGFSAEPAAATPTDRANLTKVADQFTSMSTPGARAYKVGPQDVLDISVFKVPELTKSVQVAESGSINLPLVGEIQAAGKTAQDIERDLAKKLGTKYLQSPQVTVFVKEYNSQRVTVDGAVKKPGVYSIRGNTSLVQVLAMAEGLDATTASSDVVIFRTVDGKRFAAHFDVDDIRAGKASDPAMRQGDVVVADTSSAKMVMNTIFKIPFGAFVPLL